MDTKEQSNVSDPNFYINEFSRRKRIPFLCSSCYEVTMLRRGGFAAVCASDKEMITDIPSSNRTAISILKSTPTVVIGKV